MARSLSQEQLKPSTKLVANAIQRPNGVWVAQFSAPGLIPEFVRSRDAGKVYNSEGEAFYDAMAAAIAVFNSPRERVNQSNRRTTGVRPARMKGNDLAAALARHDMNPGDLAFITDKPPKRVFTWLDDTQDIPYEISLIFALMDALDAHEDAFELADNATNAAIKELGEAD